MKRTSIVLIVLFSLAMSALAKSGKPVNGQPLMAGGPEGYAPLSSGMVYSHRPIGWAFLTDSSVPDIFLLSPNGAPTATGLQPAAGLSLKVSF